MQEGALRFPCPLICIAPPLAVWLRPMRQPVPLAVLVTRVTLAWALSVGIAVTPGRNFENIDVCACEMSASMCGGLAVRKPVMATVTLLLPSVHPFWLAYVLPTLT